LAHILHHASILTHPDQSLCSVKTLTLISNTSDVPTLAGGFITLDMVKRATDEKARRTKIICTLGPACWDVKNLEIMLDAGMNVARFNFSHGDHEGHGACLERLRTAAKNKNKNCGTYEMKPYTALERAPKSNSRILLLPLPTRPLKLSCWIPRDQRSEQVSLLTEKTRLNS